MAQHILPTAAPGARIVWVSNDPTITAGDGSSPSKVLRDHVAAREKLRNRSEDVLALHRGDVFDRPLGGDTVGSWTKSGISQTRRQTICSWGPAEKSNPQIRVGKDHGLLFYSEPVEHLRIFGVDFRGSTEEDTSGVIAAGDATDIVIERCDISGFRTGVCTTHTGTRKKWSVVESALLDCYDPKNDYNGNGAFFSRTHGFELVRCLVARNAVRPDGSFTHAHGVYNLASDVSTSGFVARDCVFALNGNTGLSARTGGIVEDCLFAANAIAWNFGASNSPIRGGIEFVARRLVSTESRGIGWGGWLRNVHSGEIEDAIIANAGPGTQGRSLLIGGNDAPESGWKTNPIEQLAIRRLIVHAHGKGPEIAGPWPGASEVAPMAGDLTFVDCDGPKATGVENARKVSTTGRKLGAPQPAYPDPSRTVARYDKDVLGGPGTLAHFVEEARKHLGDASYSAKAVNRWIAAGFGKTW